MPHLQDSRLVQLLAEADQAKQLIVDQGDPTGQIALALHNLFHDIGLRLYEIVPRPAPGFSPEPDAIDTLTTSKPHFESDGWYTDEVDGDALPLFTEGDLGDTFETDIPEEEGAATPLPRAPVVDDLDLMGLAALQRDASDPKGQIALLRVGAEAPDWVEPLVQLLDLLRPPGDLLAPAAMPEEASKVQWAAGVIEERLPGLPERIQLAVLGLLGSRALNLAAHLDVDVGPRLALDRLKRFRDNQGLPYVASLAPGPHPELDTWAEDARAFWALLRPNTPK